MVGEIEVAQLLIFTTGAEQYAVDLLSVSEIRGVTEVALARPHHAGLACSLHGETVPVLDLRHDGPTKVTPMHAVIVAQSRSGLIGLLADELPEIVSIDVSKVQAVSRAVRSAGVDVPVGLVRIASHTIAVIDLPNLLVPSSIDVDCRQPLRLAS